MSEVDDRTLALCALSWAAALIHVVAAVGHVDESGTEVAFFVLLALAQLGWGVALYRAPSPALLRAGAVLSLLVVALWAASRTVGVPLGEVEPVGALDVLASANELALAALVAIRLPVVTPGLLLLSGLALVSGHVH
jgi:hypothetical protein